MFLFSNCWAKAMAPNICKQDHSKLWKFLSGFQIKIYTIFINVPFQVLSNTDKNKGKMSTTNVLNDDHDYVGDVFFFNNDNVQSQRKFLSELLMAVHDR